MARRQDQWGGNQGNAPITYSGFAQVVWPNSIQDIWGIHSHNLFYLYFEAKELKNKFHSFRISHIPREYNTEADYQANLAINLQDGEVEEDHEIH